MSTYRRCRDHTNEATGFAIDLDTFTGIIRSNHLFFAMTTTLQRFVK